MFDAMGATPGPAPRWHPEAPESGPRVGSSSEVVVCAWVGPARACGGQRIGGLRSGAGVACRARVVGPSEFSQSFR
eukprot:423441-Alexandrium_andersonii.AAC.1